MAVSEQLSVIGDQGVGAPTIARTKIRPSPSNRKVFNPTKMEELAASIREHGVLQPLVVRPIEPEGEVLFEIVAGERRWIASGIAGLEDVPYVVRAVDDQTMQQLRLVENVQREDVSALEQARGFKELLELDDREDRTEAIRQVAKKTGISISLVYQTMQLLKLSEEAQEELLAGRITVGHADLIKRLPPKAQERCITHLCWREGRSGNKWVDRGQKNAHVTDIPVRVFEEWIKSELHFELSSAPFDISDEKLIARAGSCEFCPKRLSVANAEGGEPAPEADRCLDGECFANKISQMLAKKIEELEEDGDDFVLVGEYWGSGHKAFGREVLGTHQWTKGGSTKALVVEPGKMRVGSIIKVKLSGSAQKELTPAEQKAKEKRSREMAKRKKNIGKAYRERLYTAIVENLPTELDETALRSIAVMAAARSDNYTAQAVGTLFGWQTNVNDHQKTKDTVEKELMEAPMPDVIRTILLAPVARDLQTVNIQDYHFDDHKLTNARALARSLGLEPDTMYRAVQSEFPKPGADGVVKKVAAPLTTIITTEDIAASTNGVVCGTTVEEARENYRSFGLDQESEEFFNALSDDEFTKIFNEFDNPAQFFAARKDGDEIAWSVGPQTAAEPEATLETSVGADAGGTPALLVEVKRGRGRPKGSGKAKDGSGGTAT